MQHYSLNVFEQNTYTKVKESLLLKQDSSNITTLGKNLCYDELRQKCYLFLKLIFDLCDKTEHSS